MLWRRTCMCCPAGSPGKLFSARQGSDCQVGGGRAVQIGLHEEAVDRASAAHRPSTLATAHIRRAGRRWQRSGRTACSVGNPASPARGVDYSVATAGYTCCTAPAASTRRQRRVEYLKEQGQLLPAVACTAAPSPSSTPGTAVTASQLSGTCTPGLPHTVVSPISLPSGR
jgi:hypothetical protein